jgi:hypothetical protein
VFSGGKPAGLSRDAVLSLQVLKEKGPDILCLVPCNLKGIELAFDDLGL